MHADLPNVPNGIPVVVCGIPTFQDERGIVSPFPYLNSESEMWKGNDEEDEGGGFDTDGGVTVLNPHFDPDDLGGDEAEAEDDEDDWDDDDTDLGFGILGGITHIFAPPLPA